MLDQIRNIRRSGGGIDPCLPWFSRRRPSGLPDGNLHIAVSVAGGQDLVSDRDKGDVGGGIEGGNVGGNPGGGAGKAREGGDVAIGDGDNEGDAGAGEGSEDVRIAVEDLHPVDRCPRFNERCDLSWRREGSDFVVPDEESECRVNSVSSALIFFSSRKCLYNPLSVRIV
ncbi:hypothetical protein IEQ34_013094 [Dendrobium chrysotoxum]|uniref:Uncharacterized protein n=1 Tax=Dendrobium chrysotoxum TaxID=161865 RepID=A0AAV7GQ17_DENCH|nr:hypothetical protein IEQ34_013094 [Dendrobium chrysotoxum]